MTRGSKLKEKNMYKQSYCESDHSKTEKRTRDLKFVTNDQQYNYSIVREAVVNTYDFLYVNEISC